MKRITSVQFISAFLESYNETLCKRNFEYNNPWYDGFRNWTDFMLGSEGVFSNMINKLSLGNERIKYVREWYTVDGLFIGGKDLFRSDLHYPSSVYVLIEHELGNNVEEEMWKLIHWRAPLKVIIMYDYAEIEKGSQHWAKEKIERLIFMLNEVNTFNTENEDTEYLFLIGRRTDKCSEIRWEYSTQSEPYQFIKIDSFIQTCTEQ